MRTLLTATIAPLLVVLVLADSARAAEQVITPDPAQVPAPFDQQLSIDVGYATLPACDDRLTGLGLRIHWDSSSVELTSLADLLPTALIAQGPVEQDNADADGDPATDRFVQVAWADIDGAWPGDGCAGVKLYTAQFRALAGLTGETRIRFSASSTAADHTLAAISAVVMLDWDGDGIPDATDPDDDDDGVPDVVDAFPLDQSESVDTDGDGIGNNADVDDDGDLVMDSADNCPLIPNVNQRDQDGDGEGDVCDPTPGFCWPCLPNQGGWRAILR